MPAQKLTTQELERLIAALPPSEAPPSVADAPLLRQLASMDRSLLDKLLAERRYVPGDIVFREGDRGDAMYLIQSGRVAIVKGEFQSPTVLAYWGPGELFGEMALLDDKPRSASVVVLEHARLLRVSRQKFHKLLSKEPLVGMKIMEMLSTRLRESDRARLVESATGKQLVQEVSELKRERLQLVELQRLREETIDLIVQDLRNLLSPIYAAVQMLQIVLPKEDLTSNQELFDIAVSSCESLQRMVDALQDVTRLEAGEIEMEMAEVNLRYLVERAISRATSSLEAEHVLLHPIIPADLPLVVVDSGIVERVLLNLMAHAIRHTPLKGQVTVVATWREGQVVVSVNDAGPTIPPEERECIFEHFDQVDGRKPSREGRSTRLELIFCRLAVEALGGQIWVEPGEEDVGNRFVFTLSGVVENH